MLLVESRLVKHTVMFVFLIKRVSLRWEQEENEARHTFTFVLT